MNGWEPQVENTRKGKQWKRRDFMGYNLKTTIFDSEEFSKGEIIGTISAIIGGNHNSNKRIEGEKRGDSSIVDLKLGSSSDLTTNYRLKADNNSVMEGGFYSSSSSSGGCNTKRGRTPGGGGAQQVVSCLVDGCKSDLSKCRDYHRRHKVCEMHSKTPRVTIGGREQRFCQQCSRFHSLGEFDEGKRSCRKRLEGHNRRRRKPHQPESIPSPLPTTQGSRFMALSNHQMINPSPTNSVVSSSSSSSSGSTLTWCVGAIKTESNAGVYNSSSSSSSSVSASSYYSDHHAYSYRDSSRQFPSFSQTPERSYSPLSSTSAGQILHHNPNNNQTCNVPTKLFCNGLDVIDSDRALSLLSSPPPPPPSADMGLGRLFHPNPSRPILSGMHYNMGQYLGPDQPGSSGLVSNLRSSNRLCNEEDIYPDGSSSASGGHQTLSFSWD